MRSRWLVIVVVLTVLLVACAQPPPVEKEATPTPVYPPTSSPSLPKRTPSAPPPVALVEVTIKDSAFHPATITIRAGTSVAWTNQDPVAHTIVIAGTESPTLNQGDSWGQAFDAPGTFDYHCGIHPDMKGRVIVE